jgi:hypothetical protein
MVVCAISCPGNTPQVTAFRPPSGTFPRQSPYNWLRVEIGQEKSATDGFVPRKPMDPAIASLKYSAFDRLHVLRRAEELDETLLENIPSARAPPDYVVARARTVDGGLRADRPPTPSRKGLEVREDHK